MPDGKLNQVELREKLQEADENFELLCDITNVTARQLRMTYEKLVEHGFTESQALEIVKVRGNAL